MVRYLRFLVFVSGTDSLFRLLFADGEAFPEEPLKRAHGRMRNIVKNMLTNIKVNYII